MKKQSGLQILLSAVVAGGQLASGLSVYSQDAELRPAPADVSLQSVPTTQTLVLPVVYLPLEDSSNQSGQSETSVNAELQKLFRPNAQSPTQGKNASAAGGIQLVQMTEDGQKGSKKAAEEKPGFFKRLFSSPKSNQIPGVGAPAPSIPAPPPISYETNDSRRNKQTGNSGVPAMPVSFGNATVHPNQKAGPTPVISALGFPSGTPNQKPGAVLQTPGGRSKQNADGFINPFESQDVTLEEETLLDLDSLIEEPATAAVSESRVVPKQSVSNAAALTATADADRSASSTEMSRTTPDGPFTGYRLDTEAAVQQQVDRPVETVQQLPRVVSQQQVRAEQVESRGLPVRELPIVEPESQPVTPVQADNFVVPLLKEPVMQLPVVDEKTQAPRQKEQLQVQSIPLLEEEFVSIPELPEEEPVASEEPVKMIRPIEPVEEPVRDVRSAAERLAELESQARRDQQAYRIMARTGKTGFKGFCPVELRDTRQLVDSRPEYKAKFGLQTYYFSSPECKAAFDANPARYAPAVGGSDIVLLVNTSEEVEGNLEFSLWYRDRLYLFRSRETRKIFSDDPSRFADQY